MGSGAMAQFVCLEAGFNSGINFCFPFIHFFFLYNPSFPQQMGVNFSINKVDPVATCFHLKLRGREKLVVKWAGSEARDATL